jgi:hypothetical protein
LNVPATNGLSNGARWILNVPATDGLSNGAMTYMAIELDPTTTSGNAQEREPARSMSAKNPVSIQQV